MGLGTEIALIKALGGGSGGLPPVTSKDAGKVLSVNSNGEWDAESNLFVVTVTLSPSYSNVADKTYNEILAALGVGKTVVCDRTNERYSFSGINSGGTIVFSLENNGQNQRITITSTNSVSVAYDKYIPAATAIDAGKVLTVNNSGLWAAQDNRFVVTLTLTSASGGVADKTNAEIAEAFESGKSVWFTGNMGGMVGSFPLKAVTYLTGYEYPFIGTEFDMITMNTTEISSTKYMVAMSGSDNPNNVFAMKEYPLDTPSANGVSF